MIKKKIYIYKMIIQNNSFEKFYENESEEDFNE